MYPSQASKLLLAALLLLAGGCLDISDPALKQGNDSGLCKAGETRQDDCNTCTCDDRGNWSCTEMACQDTASEDATGQDAPDVTSDTSGEATPDATSDTSGEDSCTEGDTRKLDCNDCTCNAEGEWACTKLSCGLLTAPCEGLSCGDACTICADDDPDCVESDQTKFCDTNGYCAYLDSPPECVEYVPCAGLTCGETCSICDPSDPACPRTVEHYCDEDGACTPDLPRCPVELYQPCEGRSCGSSCSPCDPNDLECVYSTPHYCRENGDCEPETPICLG